MTPKVLHHWKAPRGHGWQSPEGCRVGVLSSSFTFYPLCPLAPPKNMEFWIGFCAELGEIREGVAGISVEGPVILPVRER